MNSPLRLTRWILILAGALMATVAVAVSNAQYSRVLVGGGPDALSWGPTLFRILLLFHGGLLIVVVALWPGFSESTKKQEYDTQEAERPSMRTAIFVLTALSIVGLGLRLWNLNSDLWIDEVLTLLDFVRQPFGQMITSFPSQNQHMLYSIFAQASTGLFGESAWSFRLPAVLFGIGSIWALFFLCRRLLGIREAIFAAALMTFSYHHIWFSQNARGYTGLLFFTLLATWLWFEALEKNQWRWWLGYSAAVVFGMWVHMTMAFVVAAHGLLYLVLLIIPSFGSEKKNARLLERRGGLRPIAAWLLSVTATLQLYALALPEFLRVGLHEESKESEWTNPLWVVRESITGLSLGFAGIIVLICGGAFVAFGWISLFRKNRRLAILLILPALLAGSTMLVLGHNLWPRFFFFSMGFGILIVIHGALHLPNAILNFVSSLNRRPYVTASAGAGLATLMILASLVTLPRNYALPKQNFSGAKAYIESRKLPSDTIVAVGLADVIYGRYLAPDWTVSKTGAELEKVTQGNSNVWLVYTIPIELRAFRPDLWQAIQKDYETVQVFPGTLNGGEVFVCQSRNFKEKTNESSRSFDKGEDAAVWQAAHTK